MLGVVLTEVSAPAAPTHGLALSAGVTLYVAASNLVPEFQAQRGWQMPVAFFGGAGAFFVTRLVVEAGVHEARPGRNEVALATRLPAHLTRPDDLPRRSSPSPEPLAARMRPRTLEEFVGQEHLLAPGAPLGDAIRRGRRRQCASSGARPGTGKTTLARLIAQLHRPRVRRLLRGDGGRAAGARDRRARRSSRRVLGRGTMLFCDEIHRFNRAQQDAFLPHVERGTVTLIGATTENPSFELNGALLSRCRSSCSQPLDRPTITRGCSTARLPTASAGSGTCELEVDDDALELLAEQADGDARRALTVLEAAAQQVGRGGRAHRGRWSRRAGRRVPAYDKSGEEHFNMLSAYHKSLRGSDPQGALYWMARMIEGGEDPMTHLPPGDRHGGGGHRAGRPGGAQARGGGARRLSHAGPAGGLPAAGGDDDLPRHRAQVEPHQGGPGGRAGGGGGHRPSRCRCTSGTRRPA